jgi:hypothetical protein
MHPVSRLCVSPVVPQIAFVEATVMPSQEEIADQQKLLETHRRTLAHPLE